MCRPTQFLWSLALLIIGTGSATSQTPVWTQFPNSPGGTARNDDIHFLDPLNGWSARGRDGIYRTTNGGATWTKVNSNLNPVAHFRCIGFASTNRGWAGNLGTGSYDSLVTDTNVLYETWNGGLTWSNHPGFAEAGMKGLCAIQVFDDQTIYGAGRVRGPAFFIKSTDGGANWFKTNLTTAGVMGALMDVYFHDKTNGFIVGMNTNLYSSICPSPYTGQIARTTNGGVSWFVVATAAVPCSYFWKMSWPTPQIGYVSLQKNPTASDAIVYYKTTDGGATWRSNGIPVASFGNTQFYWQGVGFVSTNEGWAGGEGTTSPYFNSFLHTTNGGATWNPAGYNNARSINRIRFLTPTFGYAAGQQLHLFRIPLAITAEPTNQTVTAGSDVQFNVAAQGTAPLAYRWRFNGTNLAGANTNSHTLAGVQSTHAGNYDVIVSDYSGSINSAVATLTVTGAPVTILSPRIEGNDFGFSFATEPSVSYTVQWTTNLTTPNWVNHTNLVGNGNPTSVLVPLLDLTQQYFRVRRP